MNVYRSGHRLLRYDVHGRHVRALAFGGHVLVQVDRGLMRGSRRAELFDGPDRTSWYRCHRCYWQGPGWAVAEAFYPIPCPGLTRALNR